MRLRQFGDMVDDGGGALLIGLYREAKALPAGERRIGCDAVDQIERQFEPVAFFGVDREDEIALLGARAPNRAIAASIRARTRWRDIAS